MRKRKFSNQFYLIKGSFDGLVIGYLEALVASQKIDLARSLLHLREQPYEDNTTAYGRTIYFHLLMKDFNEAERLAENALAHQKFRNPDTLSLLAMAEHNEHKDGQALEHIDEALTIDNICLDALEALGTIQSEKSEWEVASKTFKRLLEIRPYTADWIEHLGTCYKNQNDLVNACAAYENVVKLDPFDAEAWADLGVIYSRLGQNDKAQSACERGLSYGRLDKEKQGEVKKLLEGLSQ